MRQTPAAQAAQNAGVPATHEAGFFNFLNTTTEPKTSSAHGQINDSQTKYINIPTHHTSITLTERKTYNGVSPKRPRPDITDQPHHEPPLYNKPNQLPPKMVQHTHPGKPQTNRGTSNIATVLTNTNPTTKNRNFPHRTTIDQQILLHNELLTVVNLPDMGTNHKGVIARRTIPPHTSLGHYSGDITTTHIGNHTMQIIHDGNTLLVDGTPRTTEVDTERILSYINEYLHVQIDTDEFPTHCNNVIMRPTGELITHDKAIKKGQPLHMFYGDSFDWSDIISPLIPHLINTTQHILLLSNHSSWNMELQEANDRYTTLLQSTNHINVMLHYKHTSNTLDRLIHDIVTNQLPTRTTATLPHPTKYGNLLTWVTELNTSLPFRWQVVFRRANSRPPPDWHTLLNPSTTRAGGRALRNTKHINYDEEASTIDFTMENAQSTQHMHSHTTTQPRKQKRTIGTTAPATPPQEQIQNPHQTTPLAHAQQTEATHDTMDPTPHTGHKHPVQGTTHTTPQQTELTRRTATFSIELTRLRAQLIRDIHHTPCLTDLRVIYHNVTTLNLEKLKQIIVLLEDAHTDIAFLSDTKCNRSVSYTIVNEIKKHCPGWKFHTAPSGTEGALTGGQMIIINDRWAPLVKGFWSDKSGLGLISSLQLSISGQTVHLMSTYWPPPTTDDSQSLWARTSQYIKSSQRKDSSPLTYLQNTIQFKILQALQTQHTAVILGGDLNAALYIGDSLNSTPCHQDLAIWNQTCLLEPCSPPRMLHLETDASFTRNGHGISRIDHAFITPNRGITSSADIPLLEPIWLTLSAHRPITIDVTIPGAKKNGVHAPSRTLLKAPPPIDLNVSDWRKQQTSDTLAPPSHIQKYQDILRNKLKHTLTKSAHTQEEASAGLLLLSQESYKAAKKVNKIPRGKDGWSPEFMAVEAHRIAIYGITHLLEKAKRIHSTDRNTFIYKGMINITTTWTAKVKDLFDADHETYTTHLDGGPERWLQALTVMSINQLENMARNELGVVKSRSHGKQRQLMRATSKQNIRRMERLRSKGRLGKLIANIMQENAPPFSLEALETPDGITKDPEAIHNKTTEFFANSWFNKPPTIPFGIHKPGADYERLLEDWEYFKSEHQSTNVPEHLLRILWDAMRKHKHTTHT